MAALGDEQGLLERLFDLVQGGAGGRDLSFGFGDGPGEPLHLGLEQIQRHGGRVVGLHELGTLVKQLGVALAGALGVLVGVGGLLAQLGDNGITQAA